MEIEFNPDLQGKDLRHSCLADQLELQAIVEGVSWSRSELSDRIENSGWNLILSPRLTNDIGLSSSLGDLQEQCGEIADQIFNLLKKRQLILGDKYPFQENKHGRLSLLRENGAYLCLLSVALSHGFEIESPTAPHKIFEESVTKAFSNTGLDALTIGTASGNGGFSGSLGDIQANFPSLVTTPDNVVGFIHANDGGGDTIAMMPFGNDSRHGHWVFVGQSTVGKSDNWNNKINEVHTPLWQNALADRVVVVPFFATPYHVSDHHLELLVNRYQRGIWDRLRLTKFLTAEETETQAALSRLRTVQIF